MTATLEAKRADQPFQFMAASYLIRIGAQPVQTLGEFAKSLRSCPQASIFYHTFQSLEAHHYTSFSSDFAQWALTACNEAALGEQLAVVDLREIVSLEDLRGILADIVRDYLKEHPQAADRRAFEAFYFCEAREVTVPSGSPAWRARARTSTSSRSAVRLRTGPQGTGPPGRARRRRGFLDTPGGGTVRVQQRANADQGEG